MGVLTSTLRKFRGVFGEIVIDVAVPMPVNVTTSGLVGELSVTVTAPVLVPVAVGVKVTVSVQLAPAANCAGSVPQLFVWAKSPPLVPVMAMLWTVNDALPLLDKITVWN